MITDFDTGLWGFDTIKPGVVMGRNGRPIAPHVTLWIVARGLNVRQAEDLAREHSADGSAAAGGDLGWARPGMFVPEFERALNALQPGQISEPVVSRFGVHLIQLIERREVQLTDAQKREAARNVLRERKFVSTYEEWAREIRAAAWIEMRDAP